MFAKNLKRIMSETKTTVTALAQRAGCSKGAVSAWVNGTYEPSQERMETIAAVLGVSVEELTSQPDAPPAPSMPVAEKKTTLTCKEAATLLHKHESYVRKGIQQGRPGFEYGSAVKTSGKWSYCIYAGKFTEVTGIAVS